jgi:hypothetical protein
VRKKIEYRFRVPSAYYSKYRVRERIEYRFRVLSAVIFTLYSYSKALEYGFRVSAAGSLNRGRYDACVLSPLTGWKTGKQLGEGM